MRVLKIECEANGPVRHGAPLQRQAALQASQHVVTDDLTLWHEYGALLLCVPVLSQH